MSFTFDDVPRSACQAGAELIEATSGTATFYICGSLADQTDYFFNSQDLRNLAERGHEIGSHGYHHLDYQKCSQKEVISDLDLNDAYFESIGLPIAQSFAYPYGSVNPRVKEMVASRFSTARGAQNSPNNEKLDRALLKAVHLYSPNYNIIKIRRLLQIAKERPTWLIFLCHGVTDQGGGYDIGINQFKEVLEAIHSNGLAMMSISSALEAFSQASRSGAPKALERQS